MPKPVSSSPSSRRVLRAEELADVLQRATAVPSLRAKYASLHGAAARPVRLRDIPVLTPDEYHQAIRELLSAPGHRQGAVLSAGGGTLANPELSMLPDDMFAPQLMSEWQPLSGEDVVANLFPAGRLQSAFHFFNTFAALSGATTVPIGHVNDDELGQWFDFLERRGVTAIAAPSATVARFIRMAVASGRSLAWLRKLLLSSSGDVRGVNELVDVHLPGARTWGLYCSMASGPVGYNTPSCSADIFHVLEHQFVEIEQEQMLVTNLHPAGTFPLLRYQTGGLGEFVTCACGRADRAIRIRAQCGTDLNYRGRSLAAAELVALACAQEEVAEAQVSLVSQGAAEEQLCLVVRLRPGVVADQYTSGWIRHQVLSGHLTLRGAVDESPDTFEVVVVERLSGATMVGGAPVLVIAEESPQSAVATLQRVG